MAAPLVVVEVPAADRGEPLVDALLKTCSDAVAAGRCVLAGEREEPDVVAVAVVSWEDERRVVDVTVGKRKSERAEWLRRRVEFKDADAMRERWRAAGLVIATLVGEARRQEESRAAAAGSATDDAAKGAPPSAAEPARAPPSAPPAAAEAPAPRAVATPSREVAWLDAGATMDPGLGDGWFRAGGFVRASVRPWAAPIFLLVGGRYAATPADDRGLSLRWASASLGAGTFFSLAPAVRLEARAEAVAQLVHARAVDGAATDTGQRWGGGARAGGDLVWSFASMWALVGGAEVGVLTSGTVVRVEGDRRGRDAPVDVAAVAGARAIFR